MKKNPVVSFATAYSRTIFSSNTTRLCSRLSGCHATLPRKREVPRTNECDFERSTGHRCGAADESDGGIGEITETQYALMRPDQRKHEPAEVKSKPVRWGEQTTLL